MWDVTAQRYWESLLDSAIARRRSENSNSEFAGIVRNPFRLARNRQRVIGVGQTRSRHRLKSRGNPISLGKLRLFSSDILPPGEKGLLPKRVLTNKEDAWADGDYVCVKNLAYETAPVILPSK